MLSTVIKSSNIKVKKRIATFKKEKLLKEMKEVGLHQIYFLEVQTMSDLHFAQKIRLKDPCGTIILLISDLKMVSNAIKSHILAFDFINLNAGEQELMRVVKGALTYLEGIKPIEPDKNFFHMKTHTGAIQIPFSKILYFETNRSNKGVKLQTKDSKLAVSTTLNSVLQNHDRLFRVHRSYVVNLNNVVEVDKKKMIIRFEKEYFCYVSRANLKVLLEMI
jgi:two-component system response regulator AgrA